MGQTATEEITIAAPPDEVVAVISDVERYPAWAEGVQEVEVLDRDDHGRPRRARFVVDARVMQVSYVLEYSYEPTRISWILVEGEQIRQLDGEYVLTPEGAGTHVRYSLEVDVDLPLPGFLKKRAAKVILDTGLKGLRQRVEDG